MGELISIVIPVYNSQKSIRRCLKSITNQKYIYIEIIVVDDKSTDNSLELIKDEILLDERIILIPLSVNCGAGFARSVGIKHSKGRYICFCDSDDQWYEDKLSIQHKLFQNDPSAIICHSKFLVKDKNGSAKYYKTSKDQLKLEDFNSRNWIGMSSAMVKADIKGIEIFSNLRRRQDYLYWINLLSRNSGSCRYIDKCLVIYNQTPGSLSSSSIQNLRWNFKMWNQIYKINLIMCLINTTRNIISKLRKDGITPIEDKNALQHSI